MLRLKSSFVFNYQVILRTNICRVRTGSDQFTEQNGETQNKTPFPRKHNRQWKFPIDSEKKRKWNKSLSETTSNWKVALKGNNGYSYKLKQLGNSSVNKVKKWKTGITDKLEKGRLFFSEELRNIKDESIKKLKQVPESSWVKPLPWNIWWRSLFNKEQDRKRTKFYEQVELENKASKWNMTLKLSKFAFKSFVHIWTGAAPTKQRQSETLNMEFPQIESMFHYSEKVLDKAFENHIKSLNSDISEATLDVIFEDEITSNENDMTENCRNDMNIIHLTGQKVRREHPQCEQNKPMNKYKNKTMQELQVFSFQEEQRAIKSCIIPVNEYETKQKLDVLLRGASLTLSVSTKSSGSVRNKQGRFQKVVEVVRERKNRTLGIAYESTPQRLQNHSAENIKKDVNSKQALQTIRDKFASEINKIVKEEVHKQVQRIKAKDTRDIHGEQHGGFNVTQARNDIRLNPEDIEQVLNRILMRLLDDQEVRSLMKEAIWGKLSDKTVNILKIVVKWFIKYLVYTYLFPPLVDALNAYSWNIDTTSTKTTTPTTITTNIISDTPREKVS